MTNLWIGFAGHWAVIGAAIALLASLRQVKIDVRWLLAALVVYFVGVAAVINFGRLLPLSDYFGPLNWNWGGKIVGVVNSIIVVTALWFIAQKPPSASGFTLAQKPGSLLPALLATVLLAAFSIGVEIWAHDGTDTSAERLWFQATMPGLEEELFWRGVFLLAMNEALRSGRFTLLGAEIGWGGVLVSLLFGLVHGMGYGEGGFSFSWLIVGVTGLIGFGLLFIRGRTGSVIIPIIAHNFINVSNSFF